MTVESKRAPLEARDAVRWAEVQVALMERCAKNDMDGKCQVKMPTWNEQLVTVLYRGSDAFWYSWRGDGMVSRNQLIAGLTEVAAEACCDVD